jgi:peroxiredoxin Q/BCP
MLTTGDKIPPFELESTRGKIVTNDDILGKKAVFYFYPKDDTPGCTKEGQAFSENKTTFDEKNVLVFGVSKCAIKKHEKFCTKYSFEHDLLSDENNTFCEDMGVWKEKSMYGKSYMGIERTTFLVDETGTIRHMWNKVKVPGHVDKVLAAIG